MHSTSIYTIPNYNPCPSSRANGAAGGSGSNGGCACTTEDSPRTRYADAILGGLALVMVAGIARRRRRARRAC